jgi:hypothetical protein
MLQELAKGTTKLKTSEICCREREKERFLPPRQGGSVFSPGLPINDADIQRPPWHSIVTSQHQVHVSPLHRPTALSPSHPPNAGPPVPPSAFFSALQPHYSQAQVSASPSPCPSSVPSSVYPAATALQPQQVASTRPAGFRPRAQQRFPYAVSTCP